MKRFLSAILFFLSATVCATQMKEQRESFKTFVERHGWQVPATRGKAETFINDLENVFGYTRKGRRPSCMRFIVIPYHASGWLHHPRRTDAGVAQTARSLMAVAEERFGKPVSATASVEAVCNDKHEN